MSETPISTRQGTLYEQLAAEIDEQIQAGTFECGDRLPSVRQVSQQLAQRSFHGVRAQSGLPVVFGEEDSDAARK